MGQQNEPHPECAHTGHDYFHRWPHVNWTLRLPCSAKRELSPHAEHRYARSLITYTHMTYMANGAITRLPPGVTAGATASALRICRRLRKAARASSLPLVPSAAVRRAGVGDPHLSHLESKWQDSERGEQPAPTRVGSLLTSPARMIQSLLSERSSCTLATMTTVRCASYDYHQ